MTTEAQDDSPWRPGADVEFERRAMLAFDGEDLDDTAGPGGVSAPTRRRHRWVAAFAVLAALGAGATLVMVDTDRPNGAVGGSVVAAVDSLSESAVIAPSRADPRQIDRPSITTAPICDAARLPDSAVDRWFAAVPDAVDVVGSLAAGGDGVAALTVDDDGEPSLRFFDADDGTERWSVAGGDVGPARTVVGVVGRVVLLAGDTDVGDAAMLNAYDVDTGVRVWSRVFDDSVTSGLDPISEVFVLAEPNTDDDRPGMVGVHDADTGWLTASATGRFVAYRDGRLVTVTGDKVLASNGPAANGQLLGVLVDTDSPFVVLGDTVVASAPDRPGGLLVSRDAGAGSVSSAVVEVDSESGRDEIGVVTSLLAVSSSSLLATSNGMIFGIEMVDDRFEARWSVDGVPLAAAASESGATVLVSREGGAAQILVDVATGREFLSAPTTFGGISEGDLYSNGVLVNGGTGSMGWRRATDLEGTEMWELPGRGDLAVGDGVVYEVTTRIGTGSLPARTIIGIRALGDAESPDPCVAGATDAEASPP